MNVNVDQLSSSDDRGQWPQQQKQQQQLIMADRTTTTTTTTTIPRHYRHDHHLPPLFDLSVCYLTITIGRETDRFPLLRLSSGDIIASVCIWFNHTHWPDHFIWQRENGKWNEGGRKSKDKTAPWQIEGVLKPNLPKSALPFVKPATHRGKLPLLVSFCNVTMCHKKQKRRVINEQLMQLQ